MKKQAEKEFITKFRLLNSQESSEDIKWSSSDSSDYENPAYRNKFENNAPKIGNRKRKRKAKVLRNVSNLDISFTDTISNKQTHNTGEKSPILVAKTSTKSSISPILNIIPKQLPQNTDKRLLPSPFHSAGTYVNERNLKNTSPILLLRNTSPVRKKLFISNNVKLDLSKEIDKIINSSKNNTQVKICYLNTEVQNDNGLKLLKSNRNDCVLNVNNNIKGKEITTEDHNTFHKNNTYSSGSDASILKTTPSLALLNKVKLFFNNHFNSETSSQNSISECETTPQNSSKTSEDIDIVSLTQDKSNQANLLEDNAKLLDIDSTIKSKKIKYKKDGLAYRLNSLIKKQNANISLWQHEKFLASNSNFVIPKAEYTAFRVQNMQFKYGTYLLEAVNINNDSYVLLINSSNVINNLLKPDVILKLYQPYKLITIDYVKLIVNISKFECQVLK